MFGTSSSAKTARPPAASLPRSIPQGKRTVDPDSEFAQKFDRVVKQIPGEIFFDRKSGWGVVLKKNFYENRGKRYYLASTVFVITPDSRDALQVWDDGSSGRNYGTVEQMHFAVRGGLRLSRIGKRLAIHNSEGQTVVLPQLASEAAPRYERLLRYTPLPNGEKVAFSAQTEDGRYVVLTTTRFIPIMVNDKPMKRALSRLYVGDDLSSLAEVRIDRLEFTHSILVDSSIGVFKYQGWPHERVRTFRPPNEPAQQLTAIDDAEVEPALAALGVSLDKTEHPVFSVRGDVSELPEVYPSAPYGVKDDLIENRGWFAIAEKIADPSVAELRKYASPRVLDLGERRYFVGAGSEIYLEWIKQPGVWCELRSGKRHGFTTAGTWEPLPD